MQERKNKYPNKESIPIHAFTNKECTESPNPELRAYLRFMYDNHPNDLNYLYRYCQQFVKYGGCYSMTWEYWLRKLDRDLKASGN